MKTESHTSNTSSGDLHANTAEFEEISVRESRWDHRENRNYTIDIHGVTSIVRNTHHVKRGDGTSFPVTDIEIKHRNGSVTTISAFLQEDKS